MVGDGRFVRPWHVVRRGRGAATVVACAATAGRSFRRRHFGVTPACGWSETTSREREILDGRRRLSAGRWVAARGRQAVRHMSVREAGAALRWSICCGRGWTSKLAIVRPDGALGRWRPRESLAVQLPHGYRDYGRREVMLGEWSPTANACPAGCNWVARRYRSRSSGQLARCRVPAMPVLIGEGVRCHSWCLDGGLGGFAELGDQPAAGRECEWGVDKGNEHAPSRGADGGKCWLEHQPNRGGERRGDRVESCSATPPQRLLSVTVTKISGMDGPKVLVRSLGIAIGRL